MTRAHEPQACKGGSFTDCTTMSGCGFCVKDNSKPQEGTCLSGVQERPDPNLYTNEVGCVGILYLTEDSAAMTGGFLELRTSSPSAQAVALEELVLLSSNMSTELSRRL